jgi:peptidylprolyl isomerase
MIGSGLKSSKTFFGIFLMREILICLGVTMACTVLVLFAQFTSAPEALADQSSISQTSTQMIAMNTSKPEKAAPAKSPTTSTSKTMSEITTPSGLKYVDVKVGEGATPVAGQKITVKYLGTLENGQKFDSGSIDFNVGQGQVIKGWDEGLLTMKVGGSRKLIIPADLAYGSRSPGAGIPPNATLLFDVELLAIK